MAERDVKKAWAGTRNDWRPELLYGGLGGVISLAALSVAGWPESHLLAYGIPLVSIIGAALLVPMVHFLWRLAWQPWDSLKADVAAIRAKVEELSPTAQTKAEKHKERPINVRLTALNYVRTYDDKQGTSEFAFRRKEAISNWTNEVVQFLAKHASGDAVERVLRADPEDRRDVFAEIAEGLPG